MGRFSRYPIVWYTITQHIFWGILMYFSPLAANATALSGIKQLFGNFDHRVIGVAVFLIGLLALTAVILNGMLPISFQIFMLLTQQIFLWYSARSAVIAISMGQYADGTVVSRIHIAADQSPYIFAAALHTAIFVIHFRLYDVIFDFGGFLWATSVKHLRIISRSFYRQ